ncbi:MAG: putative peptide maturation dehydrogenase [Solirubrobacteraceae bacterium]
MAKVRRTPYAFLYLEDDTTLHVDALLSGDLRPSGSSARVLALALLTGKQYRLSADEMELLAAVPATAWMNQEELDDIAALRRLLEAGLLLSDSDDPHLAALRRRDEALCDNEWNLYAALYHFMTQWSGVWMAEGEADSALLSAASRAAARKLIEQHGMPPPAVVELDTSDVLALEGRTSGAQFYRTLLARRTTRAFDTDMPMTLEQLDTTLLYVFGCHGYARNAADVICIKRTSPSGGGLHPIEVYPIITNVDGAAPGIYHYRSGSHSLAKLAALDGADAQDLATGFTCGQRYFGAAHVSFVLTARFYRNHWKYRRHQKAYPGILMDAAHLSQTLYLVSADLGLGAFVTLAINGRDIEERLGLDGISEGVIAMAGCGPRAAGESPLELEFTAEVPDG